MIRSIGAGSVGSDRPIQNGSTRARSLSMVLTPRFTIYQSPFQVPADCRGFRITSRLQPFTPWQDSGTLGSKRTFTMTVRTFQKSVFLVHGKGPLCGQSRRGSCHNKCCCGELFPTAEMRAGHKADTLTRDAVRQDVFNCIERFYNPTRKHTNNGMLSQVNY
jgi:hypothetical protein